MNLLKTNWMRRSPHTYPFPWLATEPGELFDVTVNRELSRQFPAADFVRRESSQSSDKIYRNYSRPLQSLSNLKAPDLSPFWRSLIEDLSSQEYRNMVACILGQDPAPSIELRLVRHASGDSIGPHTDRADKLFSHIFYFNLAWRLEWGGFLEILDEGKGMAVVARVAPRAGTSVLLARSDVSWHCVSPVRPGLATERRSLLVHGFRR